MHFHAGAGVGGVTPDLSGAAVVLKGAVWAVSLRSGIWPSPFLQARAAAAPPIAVRRLGRVSRSVECRTDEAAWHCSREWRGDCAEPLVCGMRDGESMQDTGASTPEGFSLLSLSPHFESTYPMKLNQFALGAVMVGVMGSTHAYVVDGGFESLVLTGGNFGNLLENYGPAAPAGASWTNSSNFVLGIDTTYTEGVLNFLAQQGTKSLDLTGAGYQGAVALSQTLALSAGQYMLSFYLGDIDGGDSRYNLPSSVEVLFAGVSVGTFTNSDGGATTNWKKFELPFTSDGINNLLTFSTANLNLDSYTGLDNVTVTAVAEPGSLAMVLAALGAAGLAAKRRKA